MPKYVPLILILAVLFAFALFAPANATSTTAGCIDPNGDPIPCPVVPTCDSSMGIGGCAPTEQPKSPLATPAKAAKQIRTVQMKMEDVRNLLQLIFGQ